MKPLLEREYADDLVRLLWLGLGGRTAEMESYLRRVLARWNDGQPELTSRLKGLLESNTAPGSIVRRDHRTEPTRQFPYDAVPAATTNTDELLRIEHTITLPTEPVWVQSVARELDTLVKERRSIRELAAAGLQPTHTVIFTGPPGVGKTMAARWLARELSLPLAILNLGAVMSSFLGRTGSNLREVIAYAAREPCILFLDEIDAIAKRRDDNSDIGELKRLVTVLLQELDAWPSAGLLVAATNHEQLIDPAVWRRFERRISFPIPGAEHQEQLLARLLGEPWDRMPLKNRRAIAFVGSFLSPGDITQLATRTKREAVLESGTFEDRLAANVSNAVATLSLSERKKVGAVLARMKLGQREIHRFTGLARETIREIERS